MGISIGIVNKLNFYLAGIVPSSIFFPIVNGGLIILVFVYDSIVKKQKFNLIKCLAVTLAFVAIVLLNL